MSLTVHRTADGYHVELGPPHGETWVSDAALSAYDAMAELSDRGCHWHDAHDAMDEADGEWFRRGEPPDAGWQPAYDAEVLRRRGGPAA